MIYLSKPSEFDELDGTAIYCDVKDSKKDLIKIVAEMVNGSNDFLSYIYTDVLTLEILDHDYYDREKIDPNNLDTYTYFPYRIELGPKDENVKREVFIDSVRELLKKLKEKGYTPALSADFEDEIPGY